MYSFERLFYSNNLKALHGHAILVQFQSEYDKSPHLLAAANVACGLLAVRVLTGRMLGSGIHVKPESIALSRPMGLSALRYLTDQFGIASRLEFSPPVPLDKRHIDNVPMPDLLLAKVLNEHNKMGRIMYCDQDLKPLSGGEALPGRYALWCELSPYGDVHSEMPNSHLAKVLAGKDGTPNIYAALDNSGGRKRREPSGVQSVQWPSCVSHEPPKTVGEALERLPKKSRQDSPDGKELLTALLPVDDEHYLVPPLGYSDGLVMPL